MSYFNLVADSIIESIKNDIPFVEGNNKIINICKNSYKHNDWNDIQNIDYSSVPNDFFQCILPDLDYIENNINGLSFLITTPILDNGEPSFVIECGGTDKYEKNDNKIGWDSELKWLRQINWSSSYYLFSNALYEMYKIANRENGLGNEAEYPLGLSISVIGINEMIRMIEKTIIKDKIIGVVAGFHDGDLLKLRGINE
jgi:hypothetical protein